ncbi:MULTISPECIES: metallophosphoesterase [unclassified Ensifer]|uniref:metallophosphoesterase n=1 Tax=unclassified Ensifer TaxID=2633371 RepID=UPI00070BFC4A|nr:MULTISPECIES: metallophosphoesterase [unclassified Ensifer]KQW47204.1 phosphatase [Ensifer sp. Root1252]KRC68756.1 phosphatase [Ensifer sp. Root231]KRC93922.1 phosphatase [Ensifer sp. Root258]
MKAWIISDLHLEFGEAFSVSPPRDADILICAGDLLTKGIVPSIEWLAKIATSIPVVFVAGNHEYYGGSVQEGIRDGRLLRERHPNVHFLENEAVTIGNVTFLGGTLWTDFRVSGRDPAIAMAAAEAGMNDYRKIKLSKQPYRKFKPIHAYRMHQETRSFLTSTLSRTAERKTMVVTHHAPSGRSIAQAFSGDPLSACYASDLDDLVIEQGPAVWVHGHVHHRVDYQIGQTRVISNPRGYPGESSGFDPDLVVEI